MLKPVGAQGRFPHNDTNGIDCKPVLSIHPVSDSGKPLNYDGLMTKEEPWGKWSARFKSHLQEKKLRLATVAERMNLAESTLRSWLNGTRKINLDDFVRLCQAAEANPARIFIGPSEFTPEMRQRMGDIMADILAADPASSRAYPSAIRRLQRDMEHRVSEPVPEEKPLVSGKLDSPTRLNTTRRRKVR